MLLIELIHQSSKFCLITLQISLVLGYLDIDLSSLLLKLIFV